MTRLEKYVCAMIIIMGIIVGGGIAALGSYTLELQEQVIALKLQLEK